LLSAAIFDEHDPLKAKTIYFESNSPRFTLDLSSLQLARRNLEKSSYVFLLLNTSNFFILPLTEITLPKN
jgi:hypothetical protein